MALYLFRKPDLFTWLGRLENTQSVILLLEDGVYNGIKSSLFCKTMFTTCRACTFYAILEDVCCRGLKSKLAPEIQCIDYLTFLKLIDIHKNPISCQ